ncbi:uncharacterized protein LOC143540735 [Bidens hawaiensis]|uniref:uncharacterized protein LOC143540735 n=1 Tax=Bidens hawaiensis TaxID=980011 RepID=UPI004049F36A
MEDNDWETIQPSSSDEADSDTVLLTNFTDPDDQYQQPPQEPPSSESSTTNPHEIIDRELPQPVEATRLGVLSSWVRSRIGVWSVFATVGAFVTVTVYANRWRRRRRMVENGDKEKLVVMLKHKDEKIRQLLIQIDRLNAMLSARRRVPVIRVVVDNPVVIGPRLS